MKKNAIFKYLIVIAFFQSNLINTQAQVEIKMPESSSDTIAITDLGVYLYQNKFYNTYYKIKPLLCHFPETEKIFKKVRRDMISSGPVILGSFIGLMYVSFLHSFDCNFSLGGPPADPPDCPSIFTSYPIVMLPLITGGMGIFNLTTLGYQKKKSIRLFNELVKSNYD